MKTEHIRDIMDRLTRSKYMSLDHQSKDELLFDYAEYKGITEPWLDWIGVEEEFVWHLHDEKEELV